MVCPDILTGTAVQTRVQRHISGHPGHGPQVRHARPDVGPRLPGPTGGRPGEHGVLLEQAGYDGWYVLEQDTVLAGPPTGGAGEPRADVRASVAHLRAVAGVS